MDSEFDLINHYFKNLSPLKHTRLGIGDDCALIDIPLDKTLAISTDSIVENVHFYQAMAPASIGYKSLAVSLSDMAAMGTKPIWVLLALTLPKAEDEWLAGFVDGFQKLIKQYQLELIGGNIAKGPLNITTQVLGLLPKNRGLRRSSAKVGDDIYVTGHIGVGGGAYQLYHHQYEASSEDSEALFQQWFYPTPRVEIGEALREIANSAIDISDGLAADLKHVLEASEVGASVHLDDLPLSPVLLKIAPIAEAIQLGLTAGEDYELCFTADSDKEKEVSKVAEENNVTITKVGKIEREKGLRCYNSKGKLVKLSETGFQHF